MLDDLRARDARDAEREAAPMRPAKDAVQLDTSKMDIGEAVAAAIRVVQDRLPPSA